MKEIKIKIIRALKNDFSLQFSIFLVFLSFLLIKYNPKLINLFILSNMYFSYNLLKIYINNKIRLIGYYILIFIDFSYINLCEFNYIYVLAYILSLFLIVYYNNNKVSYNNIIELIVSYTIFKILILILMMLF